MKFWQWFTEFSSRLAADPTNPTLLATLDERIRAIDEGLSWEIGPGRLADRCLVISPSLNAALRETARNLVATAPHVPGWEFLPVRPPKDWTRLFELRRIDGSSVELDASSWKFLLLRYPDDTHEVVLRGDGISYLTPDGRWEAATIVLESILGEDRLFGLEYDLLDQFEQRFAAQARPIQEIREALGT